VYNLWITYPQLINNFSTPVDNLWITFLGAGAGVGISLIYDDEKCASKINGLGLVIT
jgi:hypothetical protein